MNKKNFIAERQRAQRLRRTPWLPCCGRLSLTPWLQPGEKPALVSANRFNGLQPCAEAVETAQIATATHFHRAEATVLMRAEPPLPFEIWS